jgi:hypothetical protein
MARKKALAQTSDLSGHTDTVTVACKHPLGVILQLYDWVDVDIGGIAGAKTVKQAKKRNDPQSSVRLKGFAVPFGLIPAYPIIGGYGITQGVSRKFWEEWLHQNNGSDLIENGIIFACDSLHETQQEAKSRESIRCGFEPIDPDKPPPGLQHRQITLGKDDGR